MDWELHPKQSHLSRKLYVPRLHGSRANHAFRSGGRWYREPFSRRLETLRRECPHPLQFRPAHHPKPWQPPEGRESPREEWMSWRRSMTTYAFPGWMRFHHGKGPPLVGWRLLYSPGERVSPFTGQPYNYSAEAA